MVRAIPRNDRAAEARQRWLETGERHLTRRAASEPSWLALRRRAALERFAERGFPTRRDEAWRYTKIVPLLGLRDVPTAPAAQAEIRRALNAAPRIEDAVRLVVVDGVFSAELSEPAQEPGLRAGGLTRLLAQAPNLLEPSLAATGAEGWESDPFADLSTALFEDGVALIVESGAVLARPVQVVFVATRRDPAVMRPTRLLVSLGAASELRLVETYAGMDSAQSAATLALTELDLAAGARLERLRIQTEGLADAHLGVTRARLGRDASLDSRLLMLGARLARDDTQVLLAGEGASCDLRGLYTLDGERHADCQTTLDHSAPHGTSRQLYRGVLAGRSSGVFNGLVVVRAGAQGTDASQSNDNLILSREAHADTKPQLEILADDVQCRHAATIGALDEAAVFFLRSRGIAEADARSLLVRGFAAEALEGSRDARLGSLIERLIEETT